MSDEEEDFSDYYGKKKEKDQKNELKKSKQQSESNSNEIENDNRLSEAQFSSPQQPEPKQKTQNFQNYPQRSFSNQQINMYNMNQNQKNRYNAPPQSQRGGNQYGLPNEGFFPTSTLQKENIDIKAIQQMIDQKINYFKQSVSREITNLIFDRFEEINDMLRQQMSNPMDNPYQRPSGNYQRGGQNYDDYRNQNFQLRNNAYNQSFNRDNYDNPSNFF